MIRTIAQQLVVHTCMFFVLLTLSIRDKVHPKAFLFADGKSVFRERVDHEKHIIFAHLLAVPETAARTAHTVLVPKQLPVAQRIARVREWMRVYSITFPIILKPNKGMRSLGTFMVHTEAGLDDICAKIHNRYIAQPYYGVGYEVGVSFTRDPDGDKDVFGVALKQPKNFVIDTSQPWQKIKLEFTYSDESEKFGEQMHAFCNTVSDTLKSTTFRFDAYLADVSDTGVATMHIIDVNMGVFVGDEFLIPHSFSQVFAKTKQKYTYLWEYGKDNYHAHENPPSSYVLLKQQAEYAARMKALERRARQHERRRPSVPVN
jgi:hypothetical protein